MRPLSGRRTREAFAGDRNTTRGFARPRPLPAPDTGQCMPRTQTAARWWWGADHCPPLPPPPPRVRELKKLTRTGGITPPHALQEPQVALRTTGCHRRCSAKISRLRARREGMCLLQVSCAARGHHAAPSRTPSRHGVAARHQPAHGQHLDCGRCKGSGGAQRRGHRGRVAARRKAWASSPVPAAPAPPT